MRNLMIIAIAVLGTSFAQAQNTYTYDAWMFSYNQGEYVNIEITFTQGSTEVEVYSWDKGEYYYADIETSSVDHYRGPRTVEIWFWDGPYEGYADVEDFERK